jgi:predicted nucleotidyltransferase
MAGADFPPSIQTLLMRLVDKFCKTLGDNLVGVYLHGSLAMGCFNPLTSDVDFLVVVRVPLSIETKKEILAFALELAEATPEKGLEFSIVLLEHTLYFVFPTPYELHLSPFWYDRARNGEIDLTTPQTDPDLAAHFTITRAYGRCLFGDPIADVFGDVPEQHYCAALVYDLEGILGDIGGNPVYNILNVCRITAYRQDKRVLSKRDGGLWGLEHLASAYHPLIQQALDVYQAQTLQNVRWNPELLAQFGAEAKRLLV